MKGEKDIEEILDRVRIPSDEEVEVAGLRFDRRLRRVRWRRRMIWGSSSVAAMILCGVVFALLWVEGEKEKVVEIAKGPDMMKMEHAVAVPTLILSDGVVLNLKEEHIDTLVRNSNIQITGDSIKYDTTSTLREEVAYNTLVVPSGYTYNVTLADGTEVILNAGSWLKYPEKFVGDSRDVELSGEAYFNVTKSERPFGVYVSDSKIRVYGTQFNVKSTPGKTVEAVLVEGKIGFKAPGRDEVRVVPGELVTYRVGSGRVEVEQVDVEYATAWLEGVFKYRDKSLDLVLEDFSVWYGVKFEPRMDVTMIEVTMNLSKKTPIDEVISFIELMTGCKFVKEERGNYIVKKQE